MGHRTPEHSFLRLGSFGTSAKQDHGFPATSAMDTHRPSPEDETSKPALQRWVGESDGCAVPPGLATNFMLNYFVPTGLAPIPYEGSSYFPASRRMVRPELADRRAASRISVTMTLVLREEGPSVATPSTITARRKDSESS